PPKSILSANRNRMIPPATLSECIRIPMASRIICPATTATTRMTVAYSVARRAVRCRSDRVSAAVNPAKIATFPIGSIVVQMVAKSLQILISSGDMCRNMRLRLIRTADQVRDKVGSEIGLVRRTLENLLRRARRVCNANPARTFGCDDERSAGPQHRRPLRTWVIVWRNQTVYQ